jgi:hypothetical protein
MARLDAPIRRSGPPTPEPCLIQSRRTRFRGGTLIAIDVHDFAAHEQRLRDSEGYRPRTCPRCGAGPLHVHDYLPRILAGDPRFARIRIVRYLCPATRCGATWRVIPAFVARHLWRHWDTVGRVIAGNPPPRVMLCVPARTRRRWNARLKSAARQLVHLLAHHDEEQVAGFASMAGFRSTRRHLVQLLTGARALGVHGPADIAAAIHILEPGIRLM